MELKHANELIDFISLTPSAIQTCEYVKTILKSNGFTELNQSENWSLKPNSKYFVTKNSSAIIGFCTSKEDLNGFNIIASHIDSPAISIKPNSETLVENKYLKLNTEVYGGAILSSWFDRPLSLCGRVMINSDNDLKPKEKFLNIHRPLMIIPSLAIHLNREVNNGYKYSPQKDMEPLLALVTEKLENNDYLLELIANELKIQKSEILDFELFLYEYEKGTVCGLNNEFISATHLDDLMMSFNSLKAFLSEIEKTSEHTRVLVLLDNEEIGSSTAQGAKGSFLRSTLERICIATDKTDKELYYKALENTVIISSDLAHALHPNHTEKTDPTNRPILGGGVCVKYSSAQKYSTNAISGAIFNSLCKKAGISFQKFANHSDIVGGSTIGPMLASEFSVPVIDMGAPILSMHSIRELASVSDNYDCLKLFKAFYSI